MCEHGFLTFILMEMMQAPLSISWRRSRTLDGKTSTLTVWRRRSTTALHISETVSAKERPRLELWERHRLWTLMNTGICLFCLRFITRHIRYQHCTHIHTSSNSN